MGTYQLYGDLCGEKLMSNNNKMIKNQLIPS